MEVEQIWALERVLRRAHVILVALNVKKNFTADKKFNKHVNKLFGGKSGKRSIYRTLASALQLANGPRHQPLPSVAFLLPPGIELNDLQRGEFTNAAKQLFPQRADNESVVSVHIWSDNISDSTSSNSDFRKDIWGKLVRRHKGPLAYAACRQYLAWLSLTGDRKMMMMQNPLNWNAFPKDWFDRRFGDHISLSTESTVVRSYTARRSNADVYGVLTPLWQQLDDEIHSSRSDISIQMQDPTLPFQRRDAEVKELIQQVQNEPEKVMMRGTGIDAAASTDHREQGVASSNSQRVGFSSQTVTASEVPGRNVKPPVQTIQELLDNCATLVRMRHQCNAPGANVHEEASLLSKGFEQQSEWRIELHLEALIILVLAFFESVWDQLQADHTTPLRFPTVKIEEPPSGSMDQSIALIIEYQSPAERLLQVSKPNGIDAIDWTQFSQILYSLDMTQRWDSQELFGSHCSLGDDHGEKRPEANQRRVRVRFQRERLKTSKSRTSVLVASPQGEDSQ